MNLEQWTRIEQLFHLAAQHDPADRVALLAKLCPDDAAMRREVLSLLEYAERGQGITPGVLPDLSTLPAPASTLEDPESTSLTGRIVERWRIEERLGHGGMGRVYRAYHTVLETPVAVKQLAPQFRDDPQFRARFIKEAQHVVSLKKHDNIVSVSDVFEHGPDILLIMEYVDGRTLRSDLANGPMSQADFFSAAMQCCRALQAAHAEGIVHLDIKPENIMVTNEGQIKICDFGVAKRLPATHAGTIDSRPSSVYGGTLGYMAPEILEGAGWDQRSDIYSLGVMFYELLTGDHPFGGQSYPVREPAHCRLGFHDVRIPWALQRVIIRMLEREPGARYAAAADVLSDLEEVQRILDNEIIATWERIRQFARRRAKVVAAAVSALILGTAALTAEQMADLLTRDMPPAMKSVAVLPFQTVGGTDSNRFLAEGLRETLTARLGRLTRDRALDVVPSSMLRERNVRTVEEAKRELDANLAIQGTLKISDAAAYLDYELIDTNTGNTISARSETADLTNPLHVQAQLTRGVIRMLGIALRFEEEQAILKKDTPMPRAHDFYLAGKARLGRGESLENVEQAINLFQRSIEADPNHAPAHAGLGLAYWWKYLLRSDPNWVEAAQRECAAASDLKPSSAEARVCSGTILQGRGKSEEAIPHFTAAIAMEPTNEEAYRGLGRAYERLGQFAKAEETLRNAINLASHYWVGYAALGGLYVRAGKYQSAIELWQQALELAGGNAYAHNNLAVALTYSGRYTDALAQYEKSIALRPTFEAYSNLGATHWRLRQFEKAATFFEHAAGLASDYRVVANLARAYYWTPNKRSQGIETFKRAIGLAENQLKIDPGNSDVHLILARCAAMIGRKSEALQHVEFALKARPANAHYLQFAAVVYNQLGDTSTALVLLQRAAVNGLTAVELDSEMELDNLRQLPAFQQTVSTMKGKSVG